LRLPGGTAISTALRHQLKLPAVRGGQGIFEM
jgi:hypothetical protein